MRHNPNWIATEFLDQLARLPRCAQQKFRALSDELEEIETLVRLNLEREQRAEGHFYDMQRRLANASSGPTPDQDEVASLTTEYHEAHRAFVELTAARAPREAKRASLDNLVSRLRNVDIPRFALSETEGVMPAPPVVAKPRKNETLTDAVSRVRSEISRKRGELRAVRQAPLPRSELIERARVAVNDLALRGGPAVVTTEGKFDLSWDRSAVRGFPNPDGAMAAASLLACLAPEPLFKLIESRIADVPGISSADRVKRLAILEEEILALELEEEALVLASNGEILRRMDVSAFAVLAMQPWQPPVASQIAAE
jgi:hypothetical protein